MNIFRDIDKGSPTASLTAKRVDTVMLGNQVVVTHGTAIEG